METEWSQPDLSLPHLFSLLRAFMHMLSLASGFQPSGSPALWRPQNVSRALGWASLIEQIMKKIPTTKEGDAFRKIVDAAIEEMMQEYPMRQGSGKLSSDVLAEAKKVFLRTATDALGCHDGHMESIIVASSSDEKDKELVLQNMKERHQATEHVKSLVNAVQSVVPVFARIFAKYDMSCCKQWRKKALEYFLSEKTLYKLSGSTIIFQSDERKWEKCFQKILGGTDVTKVVRITELCCLHLSLNKRNEMIKKLMEPCPFDSCSRELMAFWHSCCNVQVIESDEEHAIVAYLTRMLKQNEKIWLKVSPILAAATFVKGTSLFNSYVAEINCIMGTGRHADICFDQGMDPDDISERIWALQFYDQTFPEERHKISI